MPHPNGDIYDEAMTDRPTIGFGRVSVEIYRVVLIKGVGKQPYQPEIHDEQGLRPSVALDFKITPIDARQPIIAVNTMLDWTPEFRQVVRPSLQFLSEKVAKYKGIPLDDAFNPLREIQGMCVRYEWVPRPDNKPGQTWRTICFTEVFPDETACLEAAKAEGLAPTLDDQEEIPFPEEEADEGQDEAAAQRAALAAFLPGLLEQAQHDPVAFLALIGNPPWNKHFDAESKEVRELFAPF